MRCHPYRIPALLLVVSAAWLAAVSPATGQGLEPPRLLNEDEILQQINTSYPPGQRESGVRGSVVLNFRVREDGTIDPGSVSLLQASDPAFVTPATALVPRMRFAPARMNGRPLPAWIRHSVVFDVRRLPTVRVTAEPEEGTYEMSAVEEQPALMGHAAIARQIAARYPPALRDSAISGAVIVRFRILENGTVDPASPAVEMTTDPRFDEAATGVIRQARFRPAKVNGRPVKVWVTIPIQFQVQAPEPADAAGTVPAAPPADASRRKPPS
ncbi:MAG TPA: energy transducer TonB [Longimicrobium sp.]|nr:energy transducer TonB [Longimicrobium sp.]